MTAKWLKNKIVRCAKNWKPARQDIGFFEDWRNFGDLQKVGKVLKLRIALILHYLLTDFSLNKQKSSNATLAVIGSVYSNLRRKKKLTKFTPDWLCYSPYLRTDQTENTKEQQIPIIKYFRSFSYMADKNHVRDYKELFCTNGWIEIKNVMWNMSSFRRESILVLDDFEQYLAKRMVYFVTCHH